MKINDDITFGLANDNDALAIYELMQDVYSNLQDKTLYVCDDLEFVKEHIKDNGFVVVARNTEGRIVGSFIFRYPGLLEDNLGWDIGITEPDELTRVVHLESAVVSLKYRGKNLQLEMLKYAERLIDKCRYKYYIATVSPDNPASYKSLEKAGYKLITTKKKYGGLIRRIYLKEVRK